MSDKNFKEQILKHIDKVVIGLVVFIIFVYLLLLATGTSEAERLSAKAGKLSDDINNAQLDAEKPSQVEPSFVQDVKKPFMEVPKPGKQPQWFAFKRPFVLRSADFKRPHQPTHGNPILSAETEVGQVTLTWEDSQSNDNIDVLGYVLRRKEGDSGEWLKLDNLDKETKNYIDKTVAPSTQYTYRVTSKAAKIERSDVIPLDSPEQDSNHVAVETPFNLEFDTKRMFWYGDISSPNAKLRIKITYLKPGGDKEQESVTLDRGSKIIIKGIETDWKLKDFGEKKLAPGKTEKYIIIANSKNKTKRIPAAQEAPAPPPDESEKPDESGDSTPEEPEEPDETPRDPGGGWLPPDR